MSLIQPWRGRAQVPAAPIPSIVECDITETEAVADSLEILCRHRFGVALAHIDKAMASYSSMAKSSAYRGAKVEVRVLLDELLEVRNLLVKARVPK